jgi:hypothetical protein
MQAKPTPGNWAWFKTGECYHLMANQGMRPIVLSANAKDSKTICLACGEEVDCLGPPFLTSRDDQRDLLTPLDPMHPDARLIAAAPDFLEACIGPVVESTRLDWLAALLAECRNTDDGDDPLAFTECLSEVQALLDGLRSAVAKVKGR